jgi:hypothetical protein
MTTTITDPYNKLQLLRIIPNAGIAAIMTITEIPPMLQMIIGLDGIPIDTPEEDTLHQMTTGRGGTQTDILAGVILQAMIIGLDGIQTSTHLIRRS